MIKTMGVLLFPDFETLDVFGPVEMFGQLKDNIKIVLISEQQGLVQSIQGQQIMTECSLENAPHLHYLLIPGGMGTRKEVFNQPLLEWIKIRAATTELTLSICTGAVLLAKAGVLDGHQATTNKIAFDWVAGQSSKVTWIKKARWVDDGKVITSSGVSAGIDMSLYVIARLFGEAVRDEVAHTAEYNMTTDPSIDPFGLG